MQENIGNEDKLKELKDKRDQIDKQLEKSKTEDNSDANKGKRGDSKNTDIKGVDDSLKLAVSVANEEITNKLIV